MNDGIKSLLETIVFCLFFIMFLYFVVWIADSPEYQLYFWWGSGIIMFLYTWEIIYTTRRIERFRAERRSK